MDRAEASPCAPCHNPQPNAGSQQADFWHSVLIFYPELNGFRVGQRAKGRSSSLGSVSWGHRPSAPLSHVMEDIAHVHQQSEGQTPWCVALVSSPTLLRPGKPSTPIRSAMNSSGQVLTKFCNRDPCIFGDLRFFLMSNLKACKLLHIVAVVTYFVTWCYQEEFDSITFVIILPESGLPPCPQTRPAPLYLSTQVLCPRSMPISVGTSPALHILLGAGRTQNQTRQSKHLGTSTGAASKSRQMFVLLGRSASPCVLICCRAGPGLSDRSPPSLVPCAGGFHPLLFV